MSVFRVRFEVAGGHVHCRLFVANAPNQTFAKSGDFCVRKGVEFESLLRAFKGAEFIGDDQQGGIAEAMTP